MRNVWRGAIPLLAAATLGWPRPATADDAPVPARVPHSPKVVLQPIQDAVNDDMPADLVVPVVPASAAHPKAAVDLLAPPPPWPGRWDHSSPRVPTVLSGLPAAPIASVRGPAHAPVAPSPEDAPLARSTPLPTTKAPPVAHHWPAPFFTRKEPEPSEMRQAAHVEKVENSDGPAATVAEVKQRVEALYGPDSGDVSVEAQTNGGVLVTVRLPATDAETEKAKALELLEEAGPGVRVLVEVGR